MTLNSLKKAAILLATAGLFGTLNQVAQADAAHDARLALQAAYNSMDAGATHRDVNKALSYNSPDYTVTLVGGRTMNLAQQRHATQLMVGTSSRASSTTQVEQVKVSGNTAVALVKRHYDFTLSVMDRRTGKYDRYVINTFSRDKWTRTGRKWLRRSSLTLSYKAARNGKPFPSRA